MSCVYIIYSKTLDKYYVGQTDNLERRLIQHNSGYSKSTKSASPWELKHVERFNSRSEAMKRELEIKSKKSRKYIEYLIETVERPENLREGQQFDPA